MKRMIQILSVAALTLISAIVTAQPLPPYTIYLDGQLQNCSPAGSTINVQINPNSINFVNIDIPVDGNCNFTDSIEVQDYQGTITITFPCNGQLNNVLLNYIGDFLGNSTVFVILTCESTNVDCMGVVGGSAVPGTACDDGDANTFGDTWNEDCNCVGQANTGVDCLGVVGGSAMPGNPCDDGDSNTINDTWAADCNCFGDTLQMVDCLGVPGGSALPGNPCDDNDPNTINDTWNANCGCQGEIDTPGECAADFWVLQGYIFGPGNEPGTFDSTVVNPLPNELWVWNLSTTDTGMMTFLWEFGDGNTSTDAFPTHIYDGTGPYELCLTITDGADCTDTHCQTISVDSEGIIVGIADDSQNDNRSVLTLNVVAQQPLSIGSTQINGEIALWPNPVQNAINLSITSRLNEQVFMSITDMNGKMVLQSKNTLRGGTNQLQMDVTDLKSGMYMLQIGNGTQTTTRRFVKQ